MKQFIPFRHSKNHHDLLFNNQNKNQVATLMGLEAQGFKDFVERCVKDGAGWTEIGNIIGWINYGIFKSYYSVLYLNELKEHKLRLLHPAHDEHNGWFIYDHIKKEWRIISEAVNEERYFGLPIPRIEKLIFIPENKENKEEQIEHLNKHLHLDFKMIESNPFNKICFHATMTKGDDTVLVSNDELEPLFLEIKTLQDDGYFLDNTVYFDDPTIDFNDKIMLHESDQNRVTELFGITFP